MTISELTGALTDPDLLASYRRDEADLCEAGTPLAVLRPTSTEDVVRAVKWAAKFNVPIVPQGARTGLAGGANAIDGCLVLSMTNMNRILEIDRSNRLAVVQPGVVNAVLSRAANAEGLRYPPDPGSWETSTIGGNVATNAGGMCCVKYGVTTEYVLGLEVVLADGRVMRTGRRTPKGVAGYDLTRLFVGSEGTLGIITEITLALKPAGSEPLTLVAVFPSTAAAGDAVDRIFTAGLAPSLLELLDQVHLNAIEDYRPMGLDTSAKAILLAAADADLDAIAAQCQTAGAIDIWQATDATEAAELLQARRVAHPAMEKLAMTMFEHGGLIIDDIAVPRTRLAELLDEIEAIALKHGVTVGVVGHAGDGNLHPNIVVDRTDPGSVHKGHLVFDEIMERGLAMGGTCTGEHGVGLLKRDWLAAEAGPVSIEVQRAIKTALDPANLLNPGKVFSLT
ncbi:FAD-binding oxidoreductase [Allorhizocola rhizosphaerae]|uniref:FAD-binding oxidoreductase n=1 Tax=Allorhizocola rhizosphaerae TaxID=1872709 RepID=UPI001FED211E|nr:FAD-linked oxidase C-terminal domain-containing protein [Allorhizocola rhizosphaerae]